MILMTYCIQLHGSPIIYLTIRFLTPVFLTVLNSDKPLLYPSFWMLFPLGKFQKGEVLG